MKKDRSTFGPERNYCDNSKALAKQSYIHSVS